jgi:polyhydroxyalkanoate synthesis regulator phasin
VGVHKGSNKPLGRMANSSLREWKKKAHSLFDPLWKSGNMSRNQAYNKMAKMMDMSKDEAHIGKFDESQCERLIVMLEAKELV